MGITAECFVAVIGDHIASFTSKAGTVMSFAHSVAGVPTAHSLLMLSESYNAIHNLYKITRVPGVLLARMDVTMPLKTL